MVRCRIAFVALSVVALGGCENYWTAGREGRTQLASGQALYSSADLRYVLRTNSNGREVTCAEPSPDVAKIAQASIDAGAKAAVSKNDPTGGSLDVNAELALAAARAEGLSQLTKRLATIQLLRDSLYRACEAYANKAITTEHYSAVLSRYDSTVVTLLLAEMAAGSPASTSQLIGSASAGSRAAGKDAEATAAIEKISKDIVDASTERGGAVADAEQKARALKAVRDDASATPAAITTAETEQKAAQTTLAKANAKVAALEARRRALEDERLAVRASAQSDGQFNPGNTSSAGAEISKTLATMQATYLADENYSTASLICMTLWRQPIDTYEKDKTFVLPTWMDQLCGNLSRSVDPEVLGKELPRAKADAIRTNAVAARIDADAARIDAVARLAANLKDLSLAERSRLMEHAGVRGTFTPAPARPFRVAQPAPPSTTTAPANAPVPPTVLIKNDLPESPAER